MDSSGLVVDHPALYHRRGGNTNGDFYPVPRSESMTFQQQQQLLNLLNAHAAGGGSSGAGAGGLGFSGARGNGAAPGQLVQQPQHVPPHSYAASAPLISALPIPSHPPPRPAYSSMPAPRLLHQQSNPPLLPLPFSRSSSFPTPVPARPHVNGQPRKPAAQPAAPRTNGVKEQQKSRPSKTSTGGAPAAVVRPKKEASLALANNKVEAAKQPNVFVGAAADNKLQAATPTAAVAAKEKKDDVHQQAPKVLSVTDTTGFSVYSLAPHPSSLPLPRLISLRPKGVTVPASCNAEALGGGADAVDGPGAASDDLRRLLRL